MYDYEPAAVSLPFFVISSWLTAYDWYWPDYWKEIFTGLKLNNELLVLESHACSFSFFLSIPGDSVLLMIQKIYLLTAHQ